MKKAVLIMLVLMAANLGAEAQTPTSFSYQGKLSENSVPANGTYDLQISLCSDATSPTMDVCTFGTNLRTGVQVTSGVFSVTLDFGAAAFDQPDRFLEISVKTAASATFTTLSPRQKVHAVPFSVKSNSAVVADSALNASSLGGVSSANYLQRNGDGSQLVNVNGGFKWNVVTANTQMQPNNGYFVNAPTSAVDIPLTLPATPQIGDVVRVGGNTYWKLVQNPGQFITKDANAPVTSPWTTRYNASFFASMACSADGSKLIVSLTDGRIQTSDDYGSTWTTRVTLPVPLYFLEASDDGTKLVGATDGAPIYTSTDGGASWTARISGQQWSSVTTSADGSKLAAVSYFGQIFVSQDAGISWTPRESTRNWRSIASSGDGSKLIAGADDGQLYISLDYGASWTPRESNRRWWEVAVSYDGNVMIGKIDGGRGVYVSTNSGTTWAFRLFSPSGLSATIGDRSRQIAVSANGREIWIGSLATLVDGSNSSYLFYSSNFGQNWSLGPGTGSGSVGSLVASKNLRFLYSINNHNTLMTNPRGESKVGTLGSATGNAGSYLDLLYVGNGEFQVINSRGNVQLF